jgi:release factor glutamine methyltransferase
MDVGSTLRWGISVLREAGVPDAPLSAALLLAHALEMPRERVYVEAGREMSPARLSRYRDLLDKRCRREPVQYITGSREFFGLDFFVRPGVLVPRPETEFLVEKALELVQDAWRGEGPCIIADVGTGSGAIAIAVAKTLLLRGMSASRLRLFATDVSPDALAVAQENVRRHDLESVISLLQGDLVEPLIEQSLSDRLTALVSNPPYIPSAELASLDDEVRLYEPELALDGGPDGLAFYRRLTEGARALLAEGGAAAFEVGYGQSKQVLALLEQGSLTDTGVVADLAGIERVVFGRKPGGNR